MKVFRWALAGIGAVAVATFIAITALGGSVSQAEEPPGGARTGAFAEALAKRLGISVEELHANRQGALDDVLNEAVADGRITSEQADKIREHPRRAGAALGRQLHKAAMGVFAAAAEALDMTKEELRTELKSGKSLADIATARGVSVETLKKDITTAVDAKLDEAVANDKLTQERADKIAAGLAERLDKIVQHKGGSRIQPNNP
jgi:sugar-specific transcriptional regulator TrmB